MSYILEALKRAEGERRRAGDSAQDSPSSSGRGAGQRTLVFAAAALLLLNGLALGAWGVYVLDRDPEPVARAPQPPKAEQPPRWDSTLAEAARAGSGTRLDGDAAAIGRQPAAGPPRAAALGTGTAAQPQPAANETKNPGTPGTQTPPAGESPAKRSNSARDTTQPSPPPATSAPPEDAPLLAELPATLRERVGRLDVGIHVYAEKPARRFVLVNGRRYKEGDRLSAGGPRVAAITPDGAVFVLGDQAFRVALR